MHVEDGPATGAPDVVTGGEEAAAVAQESAPEGLQALRARGMSLCVALRLFYRKDQKPAAEQEAAK